VPTPHFSIAIPVFNRAGLVQRALASCLAQPFRDFEVIVVDDGSTDGSGAAAAAAGDPRVRVVRQATNSGVSPARNRAAALAGGEWLICLDSDDELMPGVLAAMADETAAAPRSVDGFRFMCRLDDGSTSPMPPLAPGVWNYEADLRWAEAASFGGRQETLPVVRTRTFSRVTYPAGRALESLYHLDFAAAFLTATSPTVARQYHADAPDQLTKPIPAVALARARDEAQALTTLLQRHGEALSRYAPRLHAQYTRGVATQLFLAGDRAGGIRALRSARDTSGGRGAELAVLALGLLGPRPLAWAQAARARRRPG
jgi:hypothetical protein